MVPLLNTGYGIPASYNRRGSAVPVPPAPEIAFEWSTNGTDWNLVKPSDAAVALGNLMDKTFYIRVSSDSATESSISAVESDTDTVMDEDTYTLPDALSSAAAVTYTFTPKGAGSFIITITVDGVEYAMDFTATYVPLAYRMEDDVVTADGNFNSLLTMPVRANQTYEITAVVSFTTTAWTDGFKIQMAVPTGATWDLFVQTTSGSTDNIPAATDARSGNDGVALPTISVSRGAVETPVMVKVLVKVGSTAGNAVLQMARESTVNITVKAGSCAKVRNVTNEYQQLADDVGEDQAGAYETVFSVPVLANRTYLVEVHGHTVAAASTTGVQHRWNNIPVGATIMDLRFCNQSAGGFNATVVRDNSVPTGNVSLGTQYAPVRSWVLITVGANAGTLTFETTTEVQDSAVTFKAGSWLTQRDVTDTVSVAGGDVANTSNTVWETDKSYVLAADTRYWLTEYAGFTSNSAAVGCARRLNDIPAGAVPMCLTFEMGNDASGFGGVIRDGTEIESTATIAAEHPGWIVGLIDVAGTGGTMTSQHKLATGETGTQTFEAGSWSLLEEVELVTPAITEQPSGGAAPQTLVVTATGTAPLTYQWYEGASGVTDTPIEGETSNEYDANPGSTTSYWCRVTNALGSADSDAAEVTVLVDPDTFTGLRVNLGFGAGSITFSPPTQVQTVSGNLGTGEIGTGGAVTFNAAGNGVTWAADPVGNGRPGCSLDEASSLRTANTSPVEVITASEFWIAVVAQISTGGVNTNSGTSYANDAVISDALSYFGLFLQNTGDVLGMNWDGDEDVAEVAGGFSFDTPHLFVLRHLAGKIGVSIDGGAFTEVDSGNTQALNSTYIELFKSTAGTVQRVMMHDSVPSNADEIITSLLGWYQVA
ncbi:MAG: hypothetical protein IT464_12700 [Planctomycetes bacterium]|nr:hypothetical protein [Planctomycetota bacterium]